MNLSIKDPLALPAPSVLDSTCYHTRGRSSILPDTRPQVHLQPSSYGPFAAPLGENAGFGFPCQMPRHLGPQFIHRLGSTVQTSAPAPSSSPILSLTLAAASLMVPHLQSHPPTHPSNPLPQLCSRPRPGAQRPLAARPSTARYAPICLPRFRPVARLLPRHQRDPHRPSQ